MAYKESEKKEIIDKACERVANGEAIRNILDGEDMPTRTSFFKWMNEDEKKAEQYTRAIRMRADIHFESIREIVNEDCTYTIVDEDGNTVTRVDSAKIQQMRLRMDAEKWMTGKENAPKYGDVTKLQHEGGDPDKPVIFKEVKTYDSNKETD